jgi:hypothetical protein
MDTMNSYWETLQEKICRKCIDGNHKGDCLLPVGETCALKSLLPEIVFTVANVKSTAYEGYVHALRRNVCVLCDWQDGHGMCRKRDTLECALDRYYPLVVEIVEDVRTRLEKQQPQPSSS